MPESIPPEQYVSPNWRVGLALGTHNIHDGISPTDLESLAMEARFGGYLEGYDEVTFQEGDQGGYFADWRLARPMNEQIALSATYNTILLLRNVRLDGQLGIKAVRSTCNIVLTSPDTPLMHAWPDMDDETSLALAYADATVLPADITAEDFR